MAPDFKPSDVLLLQIPLVGTFRRAEAELAAALIVWTCAGTGDTWRPVTPGDIGEALQPAIEMKQEPVRSWNNPIVRPCFKSLVELGYAASTFEPGCTIELTPKGFEALRKWVRAQGGAA